MRFSDLNKIKPDPANPEARPQARPAPAPARIRETPPPEPRGPEAPTAAPADRPEALKSGAPAYSARPRIEIKPVQKETSAPYRDLDLKAKEVYSRLLTLAGEFIKSVDQPYTEKYEAVVKTCRLVEETLKTNGVLLSYAAYSTPEDYLRAHTANTVILTLSMGLAAGLEAEDMKLLGFCAMAHDIGMTDFGALYSREARLTDEEFAAMAQHIESGLAKLDRIVDLDFKLKERIKHIILQTHERLDGSGYPDRLSNEAIDPLSQFIAIADAYEAMTHVRPWREPLSPPEVIKELIEKEGRGFSSKAVKALLSSLSIYPPSSLVALSTGETARVVKVNKGSLTRPLVEVLLDPEFAQLQPQLLDLLEYPLTSIERPLDMKELREHNPRFAAKLELAGLWVEW